MIEPSGDGIDGKCAVIRELAFANAGDGEHFRQGGGVAAGDVTEGDVGKDDVLWHTGFLGELLAEGADLVEKA